MQAHGSIRGVYGNESCSKLADSAAQHTWASVYDQYIVRGLALRGWLKLERWFGLLRAQARLAISLAEVRVGSS